MNKRGMVVQKMQAKIGDDAVVQDKHPNLLVDEI